MLTYTLNGEWNLKIMGNDAGLLPEDGIRAQIPGSVYSALLEAGQIPDPYYRDNELKLLPLMDNDFSFETTFTPEEALFACDRVVLRFDGMDTLADIFLNGHRLGSCYNMHRTWEFFAKRREPPESAVTLSNQIHKRGK